MSLHEQFWGTALLAIYRSLMLAAFCMVSACAAPVSGHLNEEVELSDGSGRKVFPGCFDARPPLQKAFVDFYCFEAYKYWREESATKDWRQRGRIAEQQSEALLGHVKQRIGLLLDGRVRTTTTLVEIAQRNGFRCALIEARPSWWRCEGGYVIRGVPQQLGSLKASEWRHFAEVILGDGDVESAGIHNGLSIRDPSRKFI